MNVRQLYIVMFLLMGLWLILQLTLRGKTMVQPLAVDPNIPYQYKPIQSTNTLILDRNYKLGIAFGGGGAKGFAHLGVLKALDENGLKPDILAGVSSGAVIAALYADGYSTDSILAMYESINFLKYLSIDFNESGLLSLKRFKGFLDTVLRAKTFEELKIPLRVVVTDLDHGTSVVFYKGPLTEALIASCSVPILFDPWEINGVHYVDGGLLHNLPAFALRSDCSFLIGVSLGPIQADPYETSIMNIALRSYRFVFRSNANYDKSLCNIVIEPNGIGRYDGGDAGSVKAMYKIGYETTLQVVDSIK